MPTYQYSCTECGHFFEQFQSFSEDSLTVCPECEGRLRKVFNAVGVVFKGSGFYRTDSRQRPRRRRRRRDGRQRPTGRRRKRQPTSSGREQRPSASTCGTSGSGSGSTPGSSGPGSAA